jgi:hypothetical protein
MGNIDKFFAGTSQEEEFEENQWAENMSNFYGGPLYVAATL